MTPVAKTGLHCGWNAFTQALGGIIDVTPVAKTGLHCGGQLLERCDQPGE